MNEAFRAGEPGVPRFVPLELLASRAKRRHDELLGFETDHVHRTGNDAEFEERFERAFLASGATVPCRCGAFSLLPAQRRVIFYLSSPLAERRVVKLEISADSLLALKERVGRKRQLPKVGLEGVAVLRAGRIAPLQILALGTGTGKTLMALAAVLRILLHEWDALLRLAPQLCHERGDDPVCGLSRVDRGEAPSAARLAICFVPAAVFEQWRRTFGELVAAWPRGAAECVLWEGVKKQSHSVRLAAELSRPVVWLLPLAPATLDVLSESPETAIGALVFDEMSDSMRKRVDRATSPVLGATLVAQATIDRLDGALENNPRHPLRVALQGETVRRVSVSSVERAVAHESLAEAERRLVARARLEAMLVPAFLADGLRREALSRMPTGVMVHTLPYALRSLRGHLGETEFEVLGLRETLHHVLRIPLHAALPPSLRSLVDEAGAGAVAAEQLARALARVRLEAAPAPGSAKWSALSRAIEAVEQLLSRAAACAICFGGDEEVLGAGRLVFASCCTGVFCTPCLQRLASSRCPLCRQHAACVVDLAAERAPSAAPPPAGASFEAELALLAQRQLPVAELAARAAHAAARHLVVATSRGVRLLLFYDMHERERTTPPVSGSIDWWLAKVLPGEVRIFDMEALASSVRGATAALRAYRDARAEAHVVLLCAVAGASRSIAGLDLVDTDATIVCGQMSEANKQQLTGRTLRMTAGGARRPSQLVLLTPQA